jgi:hypothetical protein
MWVRIPQFLITTEVRPLPLVGELQRHYWFSPLINQNAPLDKRLSHLVFIQVIEVSITSRSTIVIIMAIIRTPHWVIHYSFSF